MDVNKFELNWIDSHATVCCYAVFFFPGIAYAYRWTRWLVGMLSWAGTKYEWKYQIKKKIKLHDDYEFVIIKIWII
jgi:hypothetical protein